MAQVRAPSSSKMLCGSAGVFDKGFVSGVEEDDGAGAVGVIDPSLQRLAVKDSAGGIIRRADIDQAGGKLGIRRGQEAVGLAGGQMDELSSGDDIGIHISGISRFYDQRGAGDIEQAEYGAQVVAGARWR